MKKLFLFILCAVTAIAARAQFSGSGNGSEADPYRIYTDIHLAQMANFLNQEGVVFELMKDIDLTSYIAENSPSQGWAPIGVENNQFKGVLKGNGHTISGLFINRSDCVGLFGQASNAVIEHLKIKGTTIKGRMYAGTLLGYGQSVTIEDCVAELSGSEGVLASAFYGGLFGRLEKCTITNCHYIGNVTATKALESHDLGGLVYQATDCSFENCSVLADRIDGYYNVGGFASYSDGSRFSQITVTGDIIDKGNTAGGVVARNVGTSSFDGVYYFGSIEGGSNLGGIVGSLQAGSTVSFENTHSRGTISSTGSYVGGIVGKSNGGCISKMTDCSHFGDIDGQDYVGGLVGAILNMTEKPILKEYYLSDSSKNNSKYRGPYYDKIVNGSNVVNSIINCTSSGDIIGKSNVGGLLGRDESAIGYESGKERVGSDTYFVWIDGKYSGNYGDIYIIKYARNVTCTSVTNSYFSGSISGTTNVGGIVGYKESGNIANCYTNAVLSGDNNVGGIVGSASSACVDQAFSTIEIKSNVAINTSISASVSDVGRIYGNKVDDYVTIGILGSFEGNRALSQTNVMLCGVAQDIVDSKQNGTSVGPSMLKLKANYVSWGWNFDENWNILETESFPYKKYQAAPPVIKSKLESQATSISGQSLDGGTVYMYYRDREAVSTTCNGNNWTFSTDALQSGAQVQLYADVEGKVPSYFTAATVKYPGSGTEDDPYRIYTAEDLQGASNSGYYKVMNDIDLTEWINENSPERGWPAIGRNSTAATYINGAGHKVSGLWIDTTADYNGLFSNYSAGYIKNLTVEVASGKKVNGGDYTGVLIGRMSNAQILNCKIIGDVEGSVHVGGVVGYIENSELTKNEYQGRVTSFADNAFVGGVAGSVKNVTVSGNSSMSTITSTGSDTYTGGLFGKVERGSITKSSANMELIASGANGNVGGLVGYSNTPITLSYSSGSVTASGENSYTGGLVGYSMASVSDSYSTANVNGTYYVAGLVAYTLSTIDKCIALGEISGVRYGAGLVGQLDGTAAKATNSIAANNILDLTDQAAWGCRVIGGFKNSAAEPALGSNLALSTMQVSLNGVPQTKKDDNIEGVAKTESELKSVATYVALGWEIGKIWSIAEGQTYPVLLWESEVNLVTELSLDKNSAVVSVGNVVNITGDVKPLDATNKILTWASSNPSVATVEDGVVTAVALGEAVITATTTDGSNLSATCTITVIAEIVGEDTDLSQFDNIVYIETVESAPNQQLSLSVQLNNVKPLTGFQCDLYLPAGVSVVSDDYGYVDASLNEDRASSRTMTFDAEKQQDGSLRLLAYSSKNVAIIGNEGEVATVKVMLSDAIAEGTYPLILRNIVLTESKGQTIEIDYVKTTLTISGYMLGDANGDQKVNVGDLAATASYILGTTPESFALKAADANADGKINVGDLAKIASLILGTTSAARQSVPSISAGNFDTSMQIDALSYGEYMLHIFVDNRDVSFSGLQFDLQLPAGLNAVVDEYGYVDAELSTTRTNARNTDIFDAAIQEDGSLRVLCASSRNTMFAEESGEVITIRLNSDMSFNGNGHIALSNIYYTSTGEGNEAKSVKMDFAEAITSIRNLSDTRSDVIWDINGRTIVNVNNFESLPMGIYIINGKKIVR